MNNRTVCLILLALTLLVYFPALKAGFIWDDDSYVTENPNLRSPSGPWQIWSSPRSSPQYYPVVFTTFWLQYQLWGANAFGYHLINILIHGLNSGLLFLLLRRCGIPGAAIAALLFAIHPVHVESVAWVSELKNVLSLFFYLLAALTYFSRSRWRYAGALIFFTLSLLSKSVTASLPAALLLLHWGMNGRVDRKTFTALIPFFALGIGFGLHTAYLERHQVGAVGADWDWTFAQSLYIAGRALWFYLGKLLWPHPLSFIYSRWSLDLGALDIFYPLGALLVPFSLWALRRRIGRLPLVAALFFGGTLFPVLGFFAVFPMRYSFVADHFQYVASIGPIALFAAFLSRLSHFQKAATLGMALFILGALTYKRTFAYRDETTLWSDTVKSNPSAWMAHSNLGLIRAKEGKLKEARAHYETALGLKQDFSEVHTNFALLLEEVGEWDAAISHLKEAIRLDPHKALAYNNLGALYGKRGELHAASSLFETAIKLEPGNLMAQQNLARIDMWRKNLDILRQKNF